MELIVRPLSREKVLAKTPTLVGVVAGIRFYEHPTRGDESPLIADAGPEGFGLTDHWELPDVFDL